MTHFSVHSHLPTRLRLKWRRLADMPEAMRFPQSVIVDALVYVTAGSCDIYRYDPQTQQNIKKSLPSLPAM